MVYKRAMKSVLKVDIVLTIPYHYCFFVNYNYFISILIHWLKYIDQLSINSLPGSVQIACHGSWSGKLIMFSLHPTIIALL